MNDDDDDLVLELRYSWYKYFTGAKEQIGETLYLSIFNIHRTYALFSFQQFNQFKIFGLIKSPSCCSIFEYLVTGKKFNKNVSEVRVTTAISITNNLIICDMRYYLSLNCEEVKRNTSRSVFPFFFLQYLVYLRIFNNLSNLLCIVVHKEILDYYMWNNYAFIQKTQFAFILIRIVNRNRLRIALRIPIYKMFNLIFHKNKIKNHSFNFMLYMYHSFLLKRVKLFKRLYWLDFLY